MLRCSTLALCVFTLPTLGLLLVACTDKTGDDSGAADDSATTDDSATDDSSAGGDGFTVEMVTSEGTLVIALEDELTPATSANFLAYVEAGFFDGGDGEGETTFHRVVANFVVQGGGYTASGQRKQTLDPIDLETNVGLSNVRGTIAMARTDQPNSATSQFFFNLVDNEFLDYQGPGEPGYAVFGEVVEGLDVVDLIGTVEVDGNDEPLAPITITSVTAY